MLIKYKIDEIKIVATRLLKAFKNKIILFDGEMGSGKTTLIAAIVKELGVIDMASSPTFSIVNEYKLFDDKIYHFDFYRIKNTNEALDIGIDEYFSLSTWLFIEWPEKIQPLIPEDSTIIKLYNNSDNERQLECLDLKDYNRDKK